MLKDEQRAEAEKLKNAPLKDKISYFFTYYKLPVIAVLAAIFFAVSIARGILNANQEKLYVVITDQQGYEPDTQALSNQYEADSQTALPVSYDTSLELDSEKNQTNYIYHEKLLALYSANVVDIFISPQTVFESYGAEEMFCPLDTVLSEEEFSALEQQDRILYVTLKDYSEDPDHPKEGETVPVGIRLNGSALANSCGLRTEDTFIGITYNTTQPTETLAYLRMFL